MVLCGRRNYNFKFLTTWLLWSGCWVSRDVDNEKRNKYLNWFMYTVLGLILVPGDVFMSGDPGLLRWLQGDDSVSCSAEDEPVKCSSKMGSISNIILEIGVCLRCIRQWTRMYYFATMLSHPSPRTSHGQPHVLLTVYTWKVPQQENAPPPFFGALGPSFGTYM